MKILVCVKQVPDMESHFNINSSDNWYDSSDLAFRMNEYDEYAVEQAVQLKEQLGASTDITVLSIGSDQVVEVLKKAMAMGCDRGVHIQDSSAYTKDPWQIASMIVAFARNKSFDLIFTGMQSQDRGSAQVGVIVAELLGISCTTTVVDFKYNDGVIIAKRELEGRMKAVVKITTPALITCQLGLNVPRYPTLPNIMKAKKKEIVVVQAASVNAQERTVTTRIYPPIKKGNGILLEGDVNEMANQLIGILKEVTTVIR